MNSLSRRAALFAALGFGILSAGLLTVFSILLLAEWTPQILIFIVLFSLLCALGAAYLARNWPVVLIFFGAGLAIGLLLLAISFERDSLGSYGLIRLFVSLAVGLACGAVAEAVFRLFRRRAEKQRREAYLARLLYKK
ncbi:MAG: hypothetical protein IKL89_09200 [Clostridia bacterium]|nr:hypothetical protein [Clostridia bacterium]